MSIQSIMENIVQRTNTDLYNDLSSRRKMFYEPRVVHTTMFGDTSGDNEYFMNSLWHRTIDGKELNEYDDDYTLAVGCSHTFGSGCSKPWPWYIENCYNAGIPGASIHDMADVAFAIHKVKPFKKLMMFCPHGERIIVFKNGKDYTLIPYNEEALKNYKYIDLDTKMYYNSRSLNHLLYFCEKENIEFRYLNSNSLRFLRNFKKLIVDKASDNSHFGNETQKNFATYMQNLEPQIKCS